METNPTMACNPKEATGIIQLNALRLNVVVEVHGQKNNRNLRNA